MIEIKKALKRQVELSLSAAGIPLSEYDKYISIERFETLSYIEFSGSIEASTNYKDMKEGLIYISMKASNGQKNGWCIDNDFNVDDLKYIRQECIDFFKINQSKL